MNVQLWSWLLTIVGLLVISFILAGREGKESVSLDDLIRKCLDEEHAIIERVAEQALQSGSHGVKVLRTVDGLFVSAEVSDEVPFGMIHEHRNQNGLQYNRTV